MHLGQFKQTSRKVFVGTMQSSKSDMSLRIAKCFRFLRKAPNYRVYSGRVAIGAGWTIRSVKGRECVVLWICVPGSQDPWSARLLHAHDDRFDLVSDPDSSRLPWTDMPGPYFPSDP